MSTYWNDLKALKDVSDEINPPVEEPYNDDDIEQFKESVQYFIDDFISNNIKLYKDKNFETTMFEAIRDMIYTSYGVEIFDSRSITVANCMFYETYQAGVYAQDSVGVIIDNIKTYDTKGSGDTSSNRGVVSFYQVQGITVTNVVGSSYKDYWIAQSATAETYASTGIV